MRLSPLLNIFLVMTIIVVGSRTSANTMTCWAHTNAGCSHTSLTLVGNYSNYTECITDCKNNHKKCPVVTPSFKAVKWGNLCCSLTKTDKEGKPVCTK